MIKVLFLASEMEPLAKTGGLADVIGVLPKKLNEIGCDTRVILPYYREVKKNLRQLKLKVKNVSKEVLVSIDWLAYKGTIKETNVEGVTVYLLCNDEFYDRDSLYTTPNGDYQDNDIRFGFYSLGALEVAKALNFKPDIIHCNDWQSAMAPIALRWKKHYNNDQFFNDSKIVFTIHNISYQGIYMPDLLDKFGLSHSLFNTEHLEFYGRVNLLKGGIITSDLVTTVSPTYAKEIRTREYGYGLDGVLRVISGEGKLVGVLNGIDYDDWDPKRDKELFFNFSSDDLDGKYRNKSKLKSILGFEANGHKPLIGVISRLALQKGVDLVVRSLNSVLDLDVDLVILGKGDKRYEKLLRDVSADYRGNFKAIIGYDEAKARRIYAGCDMFLMPSRFEPCGLGQLISLRYGTIPIVRATGGLLDTIIDYNENEVAGNGFVFNHFSERDMVDAIERALDVYRNREEWTNLIKTGMRMDYSWKKSSKVYLKHYKTLLDRN
ncbi:MAG TPA: glycogen synthase GlgA [Thermodesulfobacteriota bacterium]|nr:glycogen synthase GlgA [Thermodesulfobacteriota bacterium]